MQLWNLFNTINTHLKVTIGTLWNSPQDQCLVIFTVVGSQSSNQPISHAKWFICVGSFSHPHCVPYPKRLHHSSTKVLSLTPDLFFNYLPHMEWSCCLWYVCHVLTMRIAERITSKGAAYPYIVPQYASHRLKVPLPNNRLSVHFDECIFHRGIVCRDAIH